MRDKKSLLIKIAAAAFWILVWEAIAVSVGSDLIICTPAQAIRRLLVLLGAPEFYKAAAFSAARIMTGFFSALVLGIFFAALSHRFSVVKILLQPVTSVIKAAPVASFVILAIIWFGSRNLSMFISFLMVFPIIYLNVLKGAESADRELREMAEIFGVGHVKKAIFIYFPQILPYLTSACSVALGLCWKSGVAAEVIGIPGGSIGEKLYRAKLYFETGDLIAWTAVIIALSVITEKIFLMILRLLGKKIGRYGT